MAAEPAESNRPSLAVVIPTRNRAQRLAACLASLERARTNVPFPVYVCDSSASEVERTATREVCDRHPWVSYSTHQGRNVAAARNSCARIAREELLVNVDDDLELEPDAIDRLLARYMEGTGRRVVAGSVSWDGTWSTLKKSRRIGYARPVRDGEAADFMIGAFFLYPRSFALAWPWNERIVTSDDIFMGALWRSQGVELLIAADARALHPELPTSSDPERIGATVRNQRCLIYALLFDSVIANPSLGRAVSYEVLGFLAGAKLYFRRPRWAADFIWSWLVGHGKVIADSSELRRMVRSEIEVTVP